MPSRKPSRRLAAARPAAAAPPPAAAAPAAPSRSAVRDAEARARLVPLAPGERPGAVTVATIAALALAAAVLTGTFTTHDLSAHGGSVGGGIGITVALLVLAGAMWRGRSWGVLAFQAFLVAEMLFSTLALMRASSWWAVVLCVAVLGLSGWLFWRLVHALARLQMPDRPTP